MVCNIAIAILVPAAWSMMTFRFDSSGALTSVGFTNLKFFTVLSNLLAGAASLLYAVELMAVLRKKKERISPWIHNLKYGATVAVTLTFLTVLVFLGPVFGFGSMYVGANFWFHLIIPLLSLLGFCAFDSREPLSFRSTFIAVVPMLLYGRCYLANILVNGVGEGYTTNDWYGFVRWGLPVGMGIFGIITLGTWMIAVVIYGISQYKNKRGKESSV